MLGFFNGQVGKLNRVFAITGIAVQILILELREIMFPTHVGI